MMRKLTHEDRAALHRDMLAGCTEAGATLYGEAWRLMMHSACALGAEELTYRFYTYLPHLVRQWKPEQCALSTKITRYFKSWVKRQRKRKQQLRRMEVDDGFMERMPAPIVEDMDDDRKILLWKCIAELGDEDIDKARITVDYYMHGHTLEQLAETVGYASPQLAHSHLMRALKLLKQKMTAALNEPPPLDGGDEEKF